MSPEEYEAMYQQVYGCSARENNSYLHSEERDTTISRSEYMKYFDYSGVLAYMDSEDFDLGIVDDDKPLPAELDYFDEGWDEEPAFYGAPRHVHCEPISSTITDAIATATDEQYSAFCMFVGNDLVPARLDVFANCPCFQLSAGRCVSFDDHDCDDCVWCNLVKPRTPAQALALMGGTLHFAAKAPALKPGFAYPATLKHTDGYATMKYVPRNELLTWWNNLQSVKDGSLDRPPFRVSLSILGSVSARTFGIASPLRIHAKLRKQSPFFAEDKLKDRDGTSRDKPLKYDVARRNNLRTAWSELGYPNQPLTL